METDDAVRPVAVVVDTNLWSGGRFDARQLSGLAARVARKGIEVWVPRQVVLEWARHAADDIAQVKPMLRRLREAHLLDTTPDLSDAVLQIVDRFLRVIAEIPHVRVLEMRGDSAAAAIADQILGTGCGELRKGVRTGAVDSSWVRDAVAAAGGDLTRIVFVTNNVSDVWKVAAALGYEQGRVIVKNQKTLTEYLSAFTNLMAVKVAVAADVRSFIPLLAKALLDARADAWASDDPHEYPIEPWLPISDLSFGESDAWTHDDGLVEISDMTLTPAVDIVGLRNVEIVDEEIGGAEGAVVTLSFDVVLHGPVEVVGYELDNDGRVQMHDFVIEEAVIVAPCIVDVRNGELGDLEQQGPANVNALRHQFWSGEDAYEWLTSQFHDMTGIAWDSGADWFGAEGVVLVGLNGRTARVGLAGIRDGEWKALFRFGDAEMSVDCRHDSGARAALGRKDSFDVYPAFFLATGHERWRGEPLAVIAAVWAHLVAGNAEHLADGYVP